MCSYTKKENHISFNIDESGEWVLCIIDDDWNRVAYYAEDLEHPFRERNFLRYISSLGKIDYGCRVKGLVASTFYAPKLKGIRKLIVGDFPRGSGMKDSYIECLNENSEQNMAFLIDLIDQEEDEYLEKGKKLLEKLSGSYTSKERCAYLTGREAGLSHRSLGKCNVSDGIEKGGGGDLLKWWKYVRGDIHYDFFDSSRNEWHDPTEIPLSQTKEYEGFIRFVSDQAQRDSVYRVWEWVLEELKASTSREEKMYAYLCGKAYLQFSKGEEIPFTAMRGLIHGIATRYDAEILEVVDIPSENNIARPRSQGEYSTVNNTNLNNIARQLVEFFDILHEEGRKVDGGKLEEIKISKNDKSCEIKFLFTKPLPKEIFLTTKDTKKRGREVHKAWKEIRGCFGDQNKPTYTYKDDGYVESACLNLVYSEPKL